MTLCIAAVCRENKQDRIVTSADTRLEAGWYGGDIGFKYRWATPGWPALIAGDVSKAEDLLLTFNEHLDGQSLFLTNALQLLISASQIHKEKICDRFIRMKFGIPYKQFLENGKQEFPEEYFKQTIFEIERLNFGCELIVCGFCLASKGALVFQISEAEGVSSCPYFSAIGTGAVIAESILYSREQKDLTDINTTLYNVYEAAKCAEIAPGVGKTTHLLVAEPPSDVKEKEEKRRIVCRVTNKQCIKRLATYFRKYGPRRVRKIEPFGQECFKVLGQEDKSSPAEA